MPVTSEPRNFGAAGPQAATASTSSAATFKNRKRIRRPRNKPRPSGLRQRNPRGICSEFPWPIVVEKERRKQRREIEDGKAEGAPGQRVAVTPVERERMTEERGTERHRCRQIQHAAHANRERKQGDRE